MEGISKETLVRLRNKPHQDKETVGALDWLIAAHCKELQEPWIPINENTPKDREVLMYFSTGAKKIAIWFNTSKNGYWYVEGINDYLGEPTHYQELPGDPIN